MKEPNPSGAVELFRYRADAGKVQCFEQDKLQAWLFMDQVCEGDDFEDESLEVQCVEVVPAPEVVNAISTRNKTGTRGKGRAAQRSFQRELFEIRSVVGRE